MNPELSLHLSMLFHYLIPIVVYWVIRLTRRKLSLVSVVVISVLVGWALIVVSTFYWYIPVGIAYETSIGTDSPEMLYDNNKTSISIFFGWLYPLLICLLFVVSEKVVSWQQNINKARQ